MLHPPLRAWVQKLKYTCEFSQLSWHSRTAWQLVWPLVKQVSSLLRQFGRLSVRASGVYKKLDRLQCIKETPLISYHITTPLSEINHHSITPVFSMGFPVFSHLLKTCHR